MVDEPTEEISPFDVGHTVGLFDGSETLGYLKLQSSMRASPVVVLHTDPKDAIEMPGAEDQQPVPSQIRGAAELGVSVANENVDLRALVGEAHHEVPRLLGDKGRVRVGR